MQLRKQASGTLPGRPGLIGGPGDPTGRTDYWPWRFAHPAVPGTVLGVGYIRGYASGIRVSMRRENKLAPTGSILSSKM